MNDLNLEKRIKTLGEIVREVESTLSFTILEIGARPLEGQKEPFYQLLDIFPESRIIAFEVDKDFCEQLNRKAKPGITFFPVALGRAEERRAFYETNHQKCCSLYKPNEKLLGMYNNLEVALLKSVNSIETFSLDYFTKENGIESVDFIKIDIQGAELDVFKGGAKTLDDVVFIVSEVEFISLYKKQPLFGDVCKYLSEQNFMFHKFLNMAARTIKPIIMNSDPNFGSQYMWSDAVFIKDIIKIPKLTPDKLLKMGLLSFIYGSPDVAFQCFKNYDDKKGTSVHKALFDLDNSALSGRFVF